MLDNNIAYTGSATNCPRYSMVQNVRTENRGEFEAGQYAAVILICCDSTAASL